MPELKWMPDCRRYKNSKMCVGQLSIEEMNGVFTVLGGSAIELIVPGGFAHAVIWMRVGLRRSSIGWRLVSALPAQADRDR